MMTKKAEAAAKAYVRNTDPRDMAYARVVSSNLDARPGPYRLLPVLGWLHPEHDHVFLSLSCLMLRIFDDRHMGTLGWNIPVNERTEKLACSMLTSFGWDGRIWPIDRGWPDDLPEETGLNALLREGRIGATFVFPPVPQGSLVLRADIPKMSTDFPLNPTISDEERVDPSEEHLTRFRQLVADPSLFQ